MEKLEPYTNPVPAVAGAEEHGITLTLNSTYMCTGMITVLCLSRL